ncbi:penicillin-binding transpeptidase domain-containing protein [Gordonia alkaliphila]|uniref:Penicillin-binding transpeptidase domain-containing protein n=1 Tax=Gordonia alkaliphila TaxID=1053547 RepID=A0ABP8YXK8_9ACTN|nr:penicillin-binding transpeptidase domain-containing protein [Gordonia alkaliphila]MCK0440363.1 penicillin-binding transpeptidase domain-containing protein [Gordonia alkaliphila]
MAHLKLRTVAVALILALVGALVACSSEDDGPRRIAQDFLRDFAAQDFAAAAARTTAPGRAEPVLSAAWAGLEAEGMSARIGRVRMDQDIADVDVTYTWTLPGKREWTYPATVTMSRSDAGWSVRWASTDVHPALGADQRLALSTFAPPRAAVNEADGSEVMGTGTVVAISFDAGEAAAQGSVVDSAARLVTVLGPLIPGLTVQGLAEKATASAEPLPLGTIPSADFDRLRDQLAVPGVVTQDQAVLVNRAPGFATAVLDQVRTRVADDMGGESGWRISVLNPNGLVADVLEDHPAVPAPAVALTLSRSVQDAAQRAVNVVGRQAMMVVLQASTGKLLAIAQNPAADRGGLLATMGTYPPGSTFKMVTSAAAMSADMVTPTSIVPCPGEIQIGPRLIPNYNGFSLGPVPLQRAFANSCNTSFADLAARMGPSDLAHAAAAMGLGAHYDIAGIDSAAGSVPIEPDLVLRAEDGFGQGTVLSTPMGMAIVAATAATGKAPVPVLINGRDTKVVGPRPELNPEVYAALRPMMRAVVTEGTATSIGGVGAVYGKTGEAEVAGGSHAWFAGYRGDLAFATLIVLGGDSTNAVNVTRDFFSLLPPGR